MFGLVCFLTSQSTAMVLATVSSPNHTFFLGKLQAVQAVLHAHILTTTLLESAEGKRMAQDTRLFTSGRRQSKTLLLSTNVDKKIVRNRVCDCHLSPDW